MPDDAADAVWSETNPNYFPPLPGEEPATTPQPDPVSDKDTGKKWPDDFRGWGSNVLPKRVKRSTK